MEFVPFPKMARLSREIIVTEKIDGTNAQIAISLVSDAQKAGYLVGPYIACVDDYAICAGSRNRWITPDNDNMGFAKWVVANAAELISLGEGRHYGEWYGSGIQRTYGLNHKRFALFNVSRWKDSPDLPACCETVPLLYRGEFSEDAIMAELDALKNFGSAAVPGFMRPEGIVVYHVAAGIGLKKTLEKDEMPKSLAAD